MIETSTKLRVVDHPLVKQSLTRLRDHQTPSNEFRATALRLSRFLVYEAMQDLSVRPVGVETPVGPGEGVVLSDYVILAPVLRAGLVLSEAAENLFPNVRIYHVGLKRDEVTLEAISYYAKLPDSLPPDCKVYVLDPMLATGGSAVAAISLFQKLEVRTINLVSFVAAPEGIEKVHKEFPDVTITTAAVDDHLNEHGYIVPGLGDAGDRIFGT
ncbi:MAG: uracil phosphoribosyltransferase [Cyanobacteriota/Melainabacteria group bacterium]|nr:uracil phosphoribosyltransferase [Cyanobacteria bacterium HKST-UBA01]MCB9471227.1 uracil phosphoribosyltransferase [Candidatus Obscuribacterales bacterium]